MGHVVVPVDPVKTRKTGRAESEKDPFMVKTGGVRNVAACPELDRGSGRTTGGGEAREERPGE